MFHGVHGGTADVERVQIMAADGRSCMSGIGEALIRDGVISVLTSE
jgi:hypothetical protein